MIVNYRKCRRCNAHYLEADFLAHRQAGYCTLECSIGEPCGISTAESMAWKDKISIPSQEVMLQARIYEQYTAQDLEV